MHPVDCTCIFHGLNPVARDQLECLLSNRPHYLLEPQLRGIVQGLYQSVGELNREMAVTESINVISSVKIKELEKELKKEKKKTQALNEKIDSLHRRKAIDVHAVKKDNKYLQLKIKEMKKDNAFYKAKARDYLSRIDDILTCVKMDLEVRRKNKF